MFLIKKLLKNTPLGCQKSIFFAQAGIIKQLQRKRTCPLKVQASKYSKDWFFLGFFG